MKSNWSAVVLALLLPVLAACYVPIAPVAPATPTVDPAIYNQVPDTTTYGPGECTATLDGPAPAHTSNTLGGQPSGEIPAGQYEVGVVADYGTAVFYMLNGAPAPANWVNSTAVASLAGACAVDNPLADTQWQVTDYADPRNTTGMTNVLSGTVMTAIFGVDNVVSGSAGCNSYSGPYQIQGQALTIPGPQAATEMACAEDVMAQETVFLNNLQAVQGYKLDTVEPRLHLLNDKGQVIILLRTQ